MPLRELCLLAAVIGVLTTDIAAAQQSTLADRMRQQTVRPSQRRVSGASMTTFSGVPVPASTERATTSGLTGGSQAESEPVSRQVPMREKIRPAVLSREIENPAKGSLVERRPIELMGFRAGGEDASGFLETVEPELPKPRTQKRPAAAEPGRVPAVSEKAGKPAERPDAVAVPRRQDRPITDSAGSQQPMASIEWVYPAEMTPGAECTVQLVIRNSGTATLFGAVAEVLCPVEVELLETEPAAEHADGGELRWVLGSLRAGESREISLRIRPQSAGEQRLEAALSVSAAAVCRLSITEPKLALSVAAPEDSELGQQTSVMVEVSNPGTGRAEDVVLVASLPEGLEHKSGTVVTIDIGTLNPGESRKARLSLTATAGGMQEIELKAAGTGELLAEATAKVEVAEPELRLALQVPDQEIAGQPGSYVLLLENSGLVATANVRARYQLPAGFQFVSADRGGRYLATERSIEWYVGTLNPGETTEFTAMLQAGKSGRSAHRLTAQTDFGELASTEEMTQVEGSADLKLELASLPAGAGSVARSGQQTTLRVLIRNAGSEPARSVGMSCELPAGMTLIDVEGPSDYIAENGVLVFRSLPEIAAGKSAEFLLQVRCGRAGLNSSRIRVASASTAQPLIGEIRTEVQP